MLFLIGDIAAINYLVKMSCGGLVDPTLVLYEPLVRLFASAIWARWEM